MEGSTDVVGSVGGGDAGAAGPEFTVHRLRFGNWIPTPITAIASDPYSTKVAVGREDGYIEIVDSGCKWHVHIRIPGRSKFGLKALAWGNVAAEAGRLFGISTNGFIFEVSLSTLAINHIRDSYGGSALCMAASAQRPSLAVGGEDGVGRLFRYDGGVLEYDRSLPTTGCRVLSICFHPTAGRLFLGCADGTIRCVEELTGRPLFRMLGDQVRGANTLIWSLLCLSDSTVVSGDSRGRVQLWDGITGVLMISLHQHTAEILALAATPDEQQVFAAGVDAKTTCIRRVAGRPRGASLTDAPSFTDAMDAADPTPSQQPEAGPGAQEEGGGLGGAEPSPADSHWVYTASHRPHTHDVFALAMCRRAPRDVSGGSSSGAGAGEEGALLLSGGLDCKLCAYSTSDFSKTRSSWILPTPCRGLVHAARGYGLVSMQHQSRVDLWALRLKQPKPNAHAHAPWDDVPVQAASSSSSSSSNKKKKRGQDATPASPAPEAPAPDPSSLSTSMDGSEVALALQLVLKGPEHVHCSALSPCGRLLAVSRGSGVRLWRLQQEAQGLRAATVEVPAGCGGYAHAMAFTQDSRRLVLCGSEGIIALLDSSGASAADAEGPFSASFCGSIDHRSCVLETRWAQGGPDEAQADRPPRLGLEAAVSDVCVSADGSLLAVTDGLRRVYVYEIDSLRLYWRLPICPAPVTAAAFHPRAPFLVVLLATNAYLAFDLARLNVTPHSQLAFEQLPRALSAVQGPLQGIVFDPAPPAAAKWGVLLHGQGACVYLDMEQPVPERTRAVFPSVAGQAPRQGRKKRKKEGAGLPLVSDYRSLVHVGCFEGQQLVVIENPWVRILEQLPDTLSRKRYGT